MLEYGPIVPRSLYDPAVEVSIRILKRDLAGLPSRCGVIQPGESLEFLLDAVEGDEDTLVALDFDQTLTYIDKSNVTVATAAARSTATPFNPNASQSSSAPHASSLNIHTAITPLPPLSSSSSSASKPPLSSSSSSALPPHSQSGQHPSPFLATSTGSLSNLAATIGTLTVRGGEASRRTLQSLHDRGVRMCIVTAQGPTIRVLKNLQHELQILRLAHIFDCEVRGRGHYYC